MRSLRLLVIGLFAFWLTGCGLTIHHRLYDSEQELPTSQIARLQGMSPLMLYEIDGRRGPNRGGTQYNSQWDGSFIIDLLPGMHALKVGYFWYDPRHQLFTSRTTYSTRDIIVNLEVEAGSVHMIQAEREGNSWRPIVRRIK